MKNFLFFIFLSFALLAPSAFASFPATIQYKDIGWNFGLLTMESSCVAGSAPAIPPGLSLGLAESMSAANQTAWVSSTTGSNGCTAGIHMVFLSLGTLTQSATTFSYVGTKVACSNNSAIACTGNTNGALTACPSGYTSQPNPADSTHNYCKSTAVDCPANSTNSSGSCTCSSGYTQTATNQCTDSSLSQCTSSTPYAQKVYDLGPGDYSTPIPSLFCVNGCLTKHSDVTVSVIEPILGVSHLFIADVMTPLGRGSLDVCWPGDISRGLPTGTTTAPSPTCSSAQYMSYAANGSILCYSANGSVASNSGPAVATGAGTGYTTTTKNTVNTDGSTSVSTTTTNNSDGTANTQTQTYASGVTVPVSPSSSYSTLPPGGGGGGGVVTGTGTGGAVKTEQQTPGQDMTAFCTAHPTAAACVTTNPHDAFCTEHPDSASCLDTGTPGADPTLGTLSLGVSSITPVSVGSVASCPADISITNSKVSGLVFSWTPICTFASGLYPVIIAMAWLSAGLIMVGAKQGD